MNKMYVVSMIMIFGFLSNMNAMLRRSKVLSHGASTFGTSIKYMPISPLTFSGNQSMQELFNPAVKVPSTKEIELNADTKVIGQPFAKITLDSATQENVDRSTEQAQKSQSIEKLEELVVDKEKLEQQVQKIEQSQVPSDQVKVEALKDEIKKYDDKISKIIIKTMKNNAMYVAAGSTASIVMFYFFGPTISLPSLLPLVSPTFFLGKGALAVFGKDAVSDALKKRFKNISNYLSTTRFKRGLDLLPDEKTANKYWIYLATAIIWYAAFSLTEYEKDQKEKERIEKEFINLGKRLQKLDSVFEEIDKLTHLSDDQKNRKKELLFSQFNDELKRWISLLPKEILENLYLEDIDQKSKLLKNEHEKEMKNLRESWKNSWRDDHYERKQLEELHNISQLALSNQKEDVSKLSKEDLAHRLQENALSNKSMLSSNYRKISKILEHKAIKRQQTDNRVPEKSYELLPVF